MRPAAHGQGIQAPLRPDPAPRRPYPLGDGHSSIPGLTEPRGFAETRARDGRTKDGGAIDGVLRARVDGDIAAFLEAFDGALADDTLESRAALREATDRLLRAGARTRIELERLEARVPLAQRDRIDRSAVWRGR